MCKRARRRTKSITKASAAATARANRAERFGIGFGMLRLATARLHAERRKRAM